MIQAMVSHPLVRRMNTGSPCTDAQSDLIMRLYYPFCGGFTLTRRVIHWSVIGSAGGRGRSLWDAKRSRRFLVVLRLGVPVVDAEPVPFGVERGACLRC